MAQWARNLIRIIMSRSPFSFAALRAHKKEKGRREPFFKVSQLDFFFCVDQIVAFCGRFQRLIQLIENRFSPYSLSPTHYAEKAKKTFLFSLREDRCPENFALSF